MSPVRTAGSGNLRLASGGKIGNVVSGVFKQKWPILSAGQPRLTLSATGMVQRNGINFRTGGINIFHLALNDYGTPAGRLMTHAEVDSLLDKAVTLKAGIVRAHTLGISIGSQPGHLVSGVSGTTSPVISYRAAAWEIIDYAVAGAASRGLYLMIPMTDELGYYHGGKRDWVNFRRPGTCSTDYNVKSANTPAERTAENYYYTDPQITRDTEQYYSDWLNHVNQYTGRANKAEPAIAVIELGNELWTAAQDAPTWAAARAATIKSIAPNVLIADGSATDGQALNTNSLASPYIDIFGTHPYTSYNSGDVTAQATQAAAYNKAYHVGEYSWSKTTAAAIEGATRNAGNIFFSAPWSLQNDSDLHNNGAAYGTDDVSLYIPGKDATQTSTVTRLQAHAQSMIDSAATATPPAGPASSDTFTGTNGTAINSTNWSVYTQSASSVLIQNNAMRMSAGASGGYGDKVTVVSKATAKKDATVTFTLTPLDITKEFYFQVSLRGQTSNDSIGDTSAYRIEINNSGVVALAKRSSGASTAIGSNYTIPGWASNAVVNIEFSVIGATQSVRAWVGSTRPTNANISGTDASITNAGSAGFVLNGGSAATTVAVDIDTVAIAVPADITVMPTANLTTANGTWNYTYGTDFNANVALGSFPGSNYSTWFDYYDGFTDTSKRGTYNNATTTSVSGGALLVDLHTAGGLRHVACPVIRASSGVTYSGQVYGRYSCRMRSVTVAGDPSGYKVAFMLWPTDDVWPAHGEYDYPETDIGIGSYAQANAHYANSAGGQNQFLVASTKLIADWHVYTIEWAPGKIEFFLDGVSIGASTTNVSTFPMRWTLQCETDLYNALDDTQRARVEIDWLAQWSRS